MIAQTPGQARQRAREAADLMRAAMAASDAHAAVGTDDWPAWEAAAKAAHEVLAAAAPAPPAPEPDAMAESRARGEVIAEMLDWLDNPAIERPSPPVREAWRRRSGLGERRAVIHVATAGTGHLAAELLAEGRPTALEYVRYLEAGRARLLRVSEGLQSPPDVPDLDAIRAAAELPKDGGR